MLAVDDYIRRNGRSMFITVGGDSEFDRMARTSHNRSPKRTKASDMQGRKRDLFVFTTESQQRAEDGGN